MIKSKIKKLAIKQLKEKAGIENYVPSSSLIDFLSKQITKKVDKKELTLDQINQELQEGE